ncbi:uncharacterized protein LOC120084426 [Benincasa hispida]|uniref:uncharacterized protein LOC120084426 n=1 Tax=Benincasa hispida TaxID=102211 RepID=UPI001901E6BB|nr:uncharacterized protein LOC120084426 [Benincasa hispida]
MLHQTQVRRIRRCFKLKCRGFADSSSSSVEDSWMFCQTKMRRICRFFVKLKREGLVDVSPSSSLEAPSMLLHLQVQDRHAWPHFYLQVQDRCAWHCFHLQIQGRCAWLRFIFKFMVGVHGSASIFKISVHGSTSIFKFKVGIHGSVPSSSSRSVCMALLYLQVRGQCTWPDSIFNISIYKIMTRLRFIFKVWRGSLHLQSRGVPSLHLQTDGTTSLHLQNHDTASLHL